MDEQPGVIFAIWHQVLVVLDQEPERRETLCCNPPFDVLVLQGSNCVSSYWLPCIFQAAENGELACILCPDERASSRHIGVE